MFIHIVYLNKIDYITNGFCVVNLMSFTQYPSIESGENEKYLKKHALMFGGQFIVTEKVHGANFQFVCCYNQAKSQIDIKCAKRTDFLLDDESFYDWKNVLERYRSDLEVLSTTLLSDSTLSSVSVYGELFGGSYPDDHLNDFKKDVTFGSAKPVQKGILYCPYVDFVAFDIIISTNDGKKYFLAYDDVLKCIAKTKLRALPILFRGNFEQCLKFCKENVHFITKVPSLYRLAEIKDNYAEGYVMKTVESVEYIKRPILKIKSPRFAEQIGFRPKQLTNDKTNEKKQMILFHKDALEKFLTQSRLDGVVSKWGPATPKIQLIGRFINDAKEDYLKTFQDVDEQNDSPDNQDDSSNDRCNGFDKIKEFNGLWKELYKEMISLCDTFAYPDAT